MEIVPTKTESANVDFGLQSASTSTVTFANLPGATSPYTNPISSAQQFFRLISN